VSGAPPWLSVDLSATSGTSITITNTADINGLSPNEYTGTITVSSTNGGNKTYAVKLVIKTKPVLSSIRVTPALGAVAPGRSLDFNAQALDQYGATLASQPGFSWRVSGGGSIDQSSGAFTAASSEGGPYTVTAEASGTSATALVRVASSTDVHVKVNCGDNQFDVSGWDRDDQYLGDTPSNHTWNNAIDISGVENAAPQDVYKSVVHYDHNYSFPDIADGYYTLRLHLADEHSNRRMTYVAEGTTILDSFDIQSVAGNNKALVKDFTVVVSDGNGLQLECKSNDNDVFECGLEIIGYTVQEPPVRVVAPNGGEGYAVGQTLTVRWESSDANAYYVVQVSMDDGLSWHSITAEGGVSGGSFEWTIPDQVDGVSTTSSQCRIKLYDYAKQSNTDVSDAAFGIGTGDAVLHSPSAHAGKALGVRVGPSGALTISLGRAEPYAVQLVRPDGSVYVRHSGSGPALHVLSGASLPSGLYILRGRVGTREFRERVTVMK
jgi:hypothetical protein